MLALYTPSKEASFVARTVSQTLPVAQRKQMNKIRMCVFESVNKNVIEKMKAAYTFDLFLCLFIHFLISLFA